MAQALSTGYLRLLATTGEKAAIIVKAFLEAGYSASTERSGEYFEVIIPFHDKSPEELDRVMRDESVRVAARHIREDDD